MTNTTLLHDTGCHTHGQGFRRQQVAEVRDTHRGIHQRLRLTFRRGNSDEQSRYAAETWTPHGWAEVVQIAGEDPRVNTNAGMPRYTAMSHPTTSTTRPTVVDCEEWTSRVLDMLLAESLDILC